MMGVGELGARHRLVCAFTARRGEEARRRERLAGQRVVRDVGDQVDV